MKPNPDSSTRTNPASLVRMFEIDDSTQREWRDAEVGAMLRHQLAAPIAAELKSPPARREELKSASIVTFGDLLNHKSPPLWALEETKQFAKSSLGKMEGPLKQVSTALYYAAIAAALARLGKRITDLKDEQLQTGLSWSKSQPWVSSAPGLTALMEQAAGLIKPK